MVGVLGTVTIEDEQVPDADEEDEDELHDADESVELHEID